jgi:hypothetical protein
MIRFQLFGLFVVGFFLLVELRGLTRATIRRWRNLARCLIWLAALVAIARPDCMSVLAHLLGIGRGADLLTYFVGVFGTAGLLSVYSRCRTLEKQLALLIRRDAIASPYFMSEERCTLDCSPPRAVACCLPAPAMGVLHNVRPE